MLFDKHLGVEKSPLPENIKWVNLGVGATQRWLRWFCVWIVVIVFILIALTFIIILKDLKVSLELEFNTSI